MGVIIPSHLLGARDRAAEEPERRGTIGTLETLVRLDESWAKDEAHRYRALLPEVVAFWPHD